MFTITRIRNKHLSFEYEGNQVTVKLHKSSKKINSVPGESGFEFLPLCMQSTHFFHYTKLCLCEPIFSIHSN